VIEADGFAPGQVWFNRITRGDVRIQAVEFRPLTNGNLAVEHLMVVDDKYPTPFRIYPETVQQHYDKTAEAPARPTWNTEVAWQLDGDGRVRVHWVPLAPRETTSLREIPAILAKEYLGGPDDAGRAALASVSWREPEK
jgi:hypothetical protein